MRSVIEKDKWEAGNYHNDIADNYEHEYEGKDDDVTASSGWPTFSIINVANNSNNLVYVTKTFTTFKSGVYSEYC